MRLMIHVISRELVERKLIFAGALMVGLLTCVTPLLPALRGESPRDTINEVAGVLALAWAGSLAAAMGATVIARDLAERRLSFYFAKPISHWSIWGGKMTAALVLTILSAFLVVIPVTLIGGGLFTYAKEIADNEGFLWGFPLLLVIGMSIAHVASIALRSRSKWVALDVFGVMAVALIIWSALRPLIRGGAPALTNTLIGILIPVIGAAFIIAGAIGIARGRVDIRLVHRATSITLISILGAAALTLAAYSMWVRSAEPDDLADIDLAAVASKGGWFAVEGRSKGRGDYTAAFLMNSQNGEWFRISAQHDSGTLRFSEDGKKVVWGEATSRSPLRMEINLSDLTSRVPVSKRMLAAIDPRTATGPILSADGSRMAVINDGVLSIYDTADRRSLASVKVPPNGGFTYFAFSSNDLIRFHISERKTETAAADTGNRKITTYQFDIRSRELSRLVEAHARFAIPNETGDRLLARKDRNQIAILDGSTGDVISTIDGAAQVRWLSDGRIVALRADGGAIRVHVLSADGVEMQVIDVGRAPRARFGSELAPGNLVVTTSLKPPESRQEIETSSVYLVDLGAGTARKVAEKMVQGYGYGGNLFADEKRSLVYFDPTTGERRTLIEGSK